MGLTVACARCHDHKYEPIPTADYYALRGVFASVKRVGPLDQQRQPLVGGYDVLQSKRADYQKQRAVIEKKIAELETANGPVTRRSKRRAAEQEEEED